MILLISLLLAAQETDVIPRNHTVAYQAALVDYEQALFKVDRDPKQAIESIEKVFDNPRVQKKDRRIQYERMNFQLGRPIDFFPNQVRGRIRINLARMDKDNAPTLLSGAIADLKASVDAGVKSSEKPLEEARAWLEKLKAPKPPEPVKESAAEQAFREGWFKLIEDHRYKAARDWVDAKGALLGPDKRRDYARDTEERCRKFVLAGLDEFLKAMELNAKPLMLRQMKAPDFNRLFALPSEADVIGASAELDWARKELPVMDKIRLSEARPREEDLGPILDLLIAQTLAAEPLERTGENRWFRASGQLAIRFVEDVIGALASMSKDAAPEQRGRYREAAVKIRAKWSETLAKFPRDFLFRNSVHENPKRLAALLDEFPVDASELDKIDLEACFIAESPDTALERVISDLTKIRDQQGTRLSKDSSRKLLTELVAATAAHELLAGRSAEEVAKGLQELGRSLAQSGGPVDVARWGPKIGKIFASLK